MSRLGKIPVIVPKTVKTFIESGSVRVEGPKGKLSISLPAHIKVEQKEDRLLIQRFSESKQARSDQGTTRAHLVNMIVGITQGHKKELEIQGVGFRAQVQGNKLAVNPGFSHPVEYVPPPQVTVTAPKPTTIIIEGTDITLVGQTAASIRQLKQPEPYKGKGIRYLNEVVKRKQGKSVTK